MIRFDDNTKAVFAKYVGADGKLIIDDSLPENIKKSFEFFNSRNINILELNLDDSDVEINDEPIEGDYDEELESEDDFGYDEEEFLNVDSDVNLADLDDLF